MSRDTIYTHAWIQEFLPGEGGPGPTARKQLWRFLVFFLVLNLFYSFTEGVQWLFKRKL